MTQYCKHKTFSKFFFHTRSSPVIQRADLSIWTWCCVVYSLLNIFLWHDSVRFDILLDVSCAIYKTHLYCFYIFLKQMHCRLKRSLIWSFFSNVRIFLIVILLGSCQEPVPFLLETSQTSFGAWNVVRHRPTKHSYLYHFVPPPPALHISLGLVVLICCSSIHLFSGHLRQGRLPCVVWFVLIDLNVAVALARMLPYTNHTSCPPRRPATDNTSRFLLRGFLVVHMLYFACLNNL